MSIMDCLNIYVFGDQTYDPTVALVSLIESSGDSLLDSFFNQCHAAILKELQCSAFSGIIISRTRRLQDLIRASRHELVLEHGVTAMFHFAAFFRCAQ